MNILKRLYKIIYNFHISKKFKSCGHRVGFTSIGFWYGTEFISIGNNCCFDKDLFLTAWYFNKDEHEPSIIIGDNCSFGAYNHISCLNRIEIGDGLLTGKWVTIVDNSHGTSNFEDMKIRPWLRKIVSPGPVIIERNVWIGDKATILPNVTIGEGAIIGANSVVTKDIPKYSVVVGNPAKVIKTYSK